MKKFLSDAVFTTASQIVTALVALGIQVYIVRNVSVGEYGQYAAVQAYVLIFEAVFIARGGEVALQYIGKYWGVDMPRALWYRSRLIRMDIRVNILIYVITVSSGLILGSIINLKWEWLALLALTVPAQIGYGVWKSVFIVAGKLKQQAYFEICYSIILVTFVIFSMAWASIEGLLMAFVVASLVKTMLARMLTQHYWPANISAMSPPGNAGTSMNQFRNANIFSIARNAFMNGALQGDLLLINAMHGPEVAALYKVAKTIAAIPVRVAIPVWVAFRPRIMSAMREKNINRLRGLLIRPAVFLAFSGVVLAWPLVSYGEYFIVLVFGEHYSAAMPVTLWLLLGAWFFGAITGWLNFACVITSRKLAGLIIYFLWLTGVVLGGLFWGRDSVESMAMVVAGSMVITAFAGWIYFIRPTSWFEDE